MPTITSGASASVPIPQGSKLIIRQSGSGACVLGPGPGAGTVSTFDGSDLVVGPFPFARSAYVTSYAGAVVYEVYAPVPSTAAPLYALLQNQPPGIFLPDGSVAQIAEQFTLATLPAASAYQGKATITDLGGGTDVISNLARFRPVNGVATIGTKDTRSATTTAAETMLAQFAVPNCIGIGDTLELNFSQTKSATSETCTWYVRFGPATDLSNAHLLYTPPGLGTPGSTAMVSGTNISGGVRLRFRFDSLTSVQKTGNATASNSYGGNSTTAFAAQVTGLSNIQAATQYLTISCAKSAGVESVAVEDASLVWLSSTNG